MTFMMRMDKITSIISPLRESRFVRFYTDYNQPQISGVYVFIERMKSVSLLMFDVDEWK